MNIFGGSSKLVIFKTSLRSQLDKEMQKLFHSICCCWWWCCCFAGSSRLFSNHLSADSFGHGGAGALEGWQLASCFSGVGWSRRGIFPRLGLGSVSVRWWEFFVGKWYTTKISPRILPIDGRLDIGPGPWAREWWAWVRWWSNLLLTWPHYRLRMRSLLSVFYKPKVLPHQTESCVSITLMAKKLSW